MKKVRTSATIETEINQLAALKADNEQKLADLTGRYDSDILAGDVQAETNEQGQTAAKRNIRRAELRTIELEVELNAARAAEAEAAKAEQQRQARAAVDAVLKESDASYRKPAAQIAAFLKRYAEASTLAQEAGVPGPHALSRATDDRVIPEHTETYETYIDEKGQETGSAYPAGSFSLNAQGDRIYSDGTRVPERSRCTKTRVIPERREPGRSLPSLTGSVSLPGFAMDDAAHWSGSSITIETGTRRLRSVA